MQTGEEGRTQLEGKGLTYTALDVLFSERVQKRSIILVYVIVP